MLSDACFLPNKTVYANPVTNTAKVQLHDDSTATYSPGVYKLQPTVGTDICIYYVIILSK